MSHFRVTIEIFETHEREIEAIDRDHAEDTLRAQFDSRELGSGRRRVNICYADELVAPGGPRKKL